MAGPSGNPDALVEPWKHLSAQTGVYYATGDHEELTDRAAAHWHPRFGQRESGG
ncbi:MAG: hypothetical protein ABSH48_14090 [Verrucomicrobiota bacterium]|jgi:hypothetical protein